MYLVEAEVDTIVASGWIIRCGEVLVVAWAACISSYRRDWYEDDSSTSRI